jgi:DNA topoisomerase-2
MDDLEQKYQKKTPIEHILLRPDAYIGSAKAIEKEIYTFDAKKQKIVFQ